MTDVLLARPRPPAPHPVPPRTEPSGRGRWVAIIASVVLLGAALGYLLSDASDANHLYDHARRVLGTTRATTTVVSRDLTAARIDLHLVTQQVGDDTTALSQDTSQLEGAKSALQAAQAHVFEQASLLNSLHTCLAGVEQALNALAVGSQSKAADALKWVQTPCSTAVSASG